MNEYEILQSLITDDLKVLIDVGCHRADFLASSGIKFNLKIGIDPLVYEDQAIYDFVINKAISSLNKDQSFYIHDNEGCSSLLSMKTDEVTHNLEEKNDKWYVAFSIENIKEKIITQTQTLEKIIDEYVPDDQVSLIKIDAQGSDIDVVQSLGKYLNTDKVKYLFIELPSRDIVLYNDQLDYQSSIQKLDEFGFELVHKHDFEIFGYDGKPCSPESNVIMKNKLL
jgi:FkbM family methyltransferase